MSQPSSTITSSSSGSPPLIPDIDPNAIASLATSVRDNLSGPSIDRTVTVNPKPVKGGFNVVWFIDFSDGISWVLRTPIVEWNPIVEKKMKSDILGLNLISSQTNIPIPKLLDFAIGEESLGGNGIGRPYLLMEKIKGTQLAQLWFDSVWFTEEKRKIVWRGLARIMVEFKKLEFSKIGSLMEENGEIVVGKFLPSMQALWDQQYLDSGVELEGLGGPYTTVHAYLLDRIKREMDPAARMIDDDLALLRLFAGSLPDEEFDEAPFVLSPADYNYQNVLVDEESGQITGLIDWDDLITAPRQAGYARYPSWITRDWDPLMYGWPKKKNQKGHDGVQENKPVPKREEIREDSPAVLQAFRDEYLAAMEEVDPETARCTRQSHIFEAVDIAISSERSRALILDKLGKYVFGEDLDAGDPVSAWSLQEGIATGDWMRALVVQK